MDIVLGTTSVRPRILGVLLAGALTMGIVGPEIVAAQTQESGGTELEEVTVTARKRSESVTETPISLSVLSAGQIEARGIRSLEDLAAFTPGFYFKSVGSFEGRTSSDLQVTLKYDRNAYSPEATEQIIGAMGWRTNQQQRAAWLTEKVTVPALLRAIQKKDIRPITAVRTPEGVPVFSAADAEELLTRLAEPTIRYALERAVLYDRPRLTVARVTKDGSGKAKAIVREFTKLSLGQQQSVMLALMLSSNSNKPLIIDQPEDNLDGEFIYSTLIPVLRRAKERRQVIIVTHNANVAVLGDAELVLVMRATSDFGKVVQRGSIDHGPTRDVACAILEGAREAFLRRAKMYGIRVRV